MTEEDAVAGAPAETVVLDAAETGGADMTGWAAAHSLARLFEGNVTNQLFANSLLMATTAACVSAILGSPVLDPRTRARRAFGIEEH